MNGHLRRIAGRARLRARAWRDRWAGQAVQTVVQRQDGLPSSGDELVETSLVITPTGCRRFTLGASPTDSRVTFLADLRESGSLPSEAFVRIVLIRPFAGGAGPVATANILNALVPGGELTAIMSSKKQRTLERGGLRTIAVARAKLARVVRLQRQA